MRTREFYVHDWERFAGKPYVKPSKLTPGSMHNQMLGPYANHYHSLGEPIREIVRRGQELLCGLEMGWIRGKLFDCYTGGRGDVTQPKSLGELCISMFENEVLSWRSWHLSFPGCFTEPGKFTDDSKFIVYAYGQDGHREYLTCSRRDIQELRTKLYHKHTDPHEMIYTKTGGITGWTGMTG